MVWWAMVQVFEGPMTADYWCRNVREPVQFLKVSQHPAPSVSAIAMSAPGLVWLTALARGLCALVHQASKALLSAQPLPSVILEVGPHPTLAASLMQTAR